MFRSPGAVALWYGWLLLAALGLIDLAVQGRDHTSAVLAAVLVLVTGVVYVAALRPRIIADDHAVTVRNPLRDTRVPWGTVADIDLGDLVRVRYRVIPGDPEAGAPARERVVHSWALQSSRRSRMRAQLRARARATQVPADMGTYGSGTYGSGTYGSDTYGRLPPEARALATQSVAVLVAAQLKEWRAAAQERGAAGGKAIVTWSRGSMAALLIPALLVAVVAVVH